VILLHLSTLPLTHSLVGYLNPSLVWQRHKRHGIERKHYLDESDIALAQDLADLLNVFYEITLQLSISGSARLANIVVFIDQITEHLSTVIGGSKYPPALKNACRIGLKITNKYYSLTDCSPLYRIAIGTFFFLDAKPIFDCTNAWSFISSPPII
jgi:hypothetical protein